MKRLVLWGRSDSLDSFRHIWGAFYRTANKLGILCIWVPDTVESQSLVRDDDVVMVVDVWSQHPPLHPGAFYVTHNVSHPSPLTEFLYGREDRWLRLQVYTDAAYGEKWDECRLYDRAGRVLFQPWGCSLLSEEFAEPVFNAQSRDCVFIGAVWQEWYEGQDLGNKTQIDELAAVCAENGLDFRAFTHVADDDMMRLTRAARLAPVVVGAWQTEHEYMPCRAFKQASFGVPVLSNSGAVNSLFEGDGNGVDLSIGDLIEASLRLKAGDYLELAREHQKVASRYTYRESIAAIDRALQEGR